MGNETIYRTIKRKSESVILMGFGGGGGGDLQNHVHDNTPLQGGPLNFNNTTIGGMGAGDITYSDGAALQTLSYPAVPAGETLVAAPASIAPAWGAGGSTYSFIEEFILGGNTNTWTVTLTTPFVLANYENLVCEAYIKHDTNYERLQHRFNGLNTDYYSEFSYIRGAAAPATAQQVNDTEIDVNSDMGHAMGKSTCQCSIVYTSNPFNTSRQYCYLTSATVEDEYQYRNGTFYNDSAVTTISTITFLFAGSNVVAGSRIRLYATASS